MIVRAPALILVSVLAYVPLLIVSLVAEVESSKRLSVQSKVLKIWAMAVSKIVGMRTERHGDPPMTTGIFVANHLSYVDVVLLASQMQTSFVAKHEVSTWPVIGHVVRMAGTVFVDRQRHRSLIGANEQIENRLRAGISVVVFAEGSSTNGRQVLPFKPSLLKMAADHGYPVNHGFLTYQISDDDAGRAETRDHICWWGDHDFSDHLFSLLRIPAFKARLVFGRNSFRDSCRKKLAGRLYQAVSEKFSQYSWI